MGSTIISPPRPLAEQFEVLKYRVKTILNGKSSDPVVLAFTSCKSAEGVTSIAANFAGTLRADKHRVLLLDGDLRRPSLHRMFRRATIRRLEAERKSKEKRENSESNSGGANQEIIKSEVQSLIASSGLSPASWHLVEAELNLDVLVARKKVAFPGELFQTSEFRQFLDCARQKYDFVVMDCPPVFVGSGSTILSSKADGVVMVVEAGRVRREVVTRAVETLEEAGAHVLGVVLNKRRYPVPKFIYRML